MTKSRQGTAATRTPPSFGTFVVTVSLLGAAAIAIMLLTLLVPIILSQSANAAPV